MSEKKEVKTIFVGGSEDLVKQVSELYKDDKFITIVILENEDLNKLVDDKMREQQTATVSGYVKDKENRKRALLIAKEIQTVFGEQMEKDFVQTSFVKRSTKYSWKEFNNLIDTLDLFGFIKWGDLRKKTFKIIIGNIVCLNIKKVYLVFNLVNIACKFLINLIC